MVLAALCWLRHTQTDTPIVTGCRLTLEQLCPLQTREDSGVVPILPVAGEMSASVLEVGKKGMLAILQDVHHRDDTLFIQYSFPRLITTVAFSLELLLPAIYNKLKALLTFCYKAARSLMGPNL